MRLPIRTLLDGLRGRLGRSMRSAGTWVEGRDAAALAGRLDKGEIVWGAFRDAGTAMRRCARFAEADRMLERGLGAFPNDPGLLYEYALCAHDSGRYALAVERWEAAVRFSANMLPERAAMCRCGLAANLRELSAFDRARAVIGEARRLHPSDLVVVSEAARIAEADADLDEALDLWRAALAAPEPPLEWVQGEIVVLVRLGRLDEAERALLSGRSRFPKPPGLIGAEGLLASARGDWPRAVAAWTAFLQHFPNDAAGHDRLAAAVAAEKAGAEPAAAAPSQPADAAHVLRACESIGDSCEFAMVQRRCGFEPDGLLSWSTLTLDALLCALQQRFAGLGEVENSQLVARPDGGYLVRDRRWKLDLHLVPDDASAASSGERRADVEARGALADACRRIAASRDRLVADLTRAEKVFVFRSDSLDGDRLEQLHRALAVFGRVRLLNVQPAAPTAPTLLQGRAGDVIRIEKARCVGFLDRLSGGDAAATADWVALCRKALVLA